MKGIAILIVGMLLISSIPVAGGDTLFKFAEGNGTDASQFGFNVTALGDINGDGYDDFAVGAPYNNSANGGRTDSGAVYIFFGYQNMDIFHEKNIDVASANVTVYGTITGGHFGWDVAGVGDTNASGAYDDVLVGCPDSTNGNAYLIEGYNITQQAAGDGVIYVSDSDGGVVNITGAAPADRFGASVSGAGNVDGLLYDDFVVGAPASNKGELFYDDFENGVGKWTINGVNWGTSATQYNTPSTSLYSSAGGAYADGYYAVMTNSVDLTGITNPRLSFWTRYQSDPVATTYDIFHVQASTDNFATSTDLTTFDSTSINDWQRIELDLSAYAGSSTLKIRFYISADTADFGEGWYLDDVRIFNNSGEAYVFYGDDSIPTSASGADAVLHGGKGTEFGNAVSIIGDVNGDGKDDVGIGEKLYDYNRGKMNIYYGGSLAESLFFSDGFEDSDLNGWYAGGGAAVGTTAHSGTYGVNAVGGAYIERSFDFRNTTAKTLSFWWETVGLDAGEYGYVSIYDGVWHDNVVTTTALAWTQVTIDLSDYYMNDVFSIKIGCLASSATTEHTYIDDINITGIQGDYVVGGDLGDLFGTALSGIGDVNSASPQDFVVGAPGYSSNTGRGYIYYGNSSLTLPLVTTNHISGYILDAGETLAQSFTATRSGVLWAIELYARDAGTNSESPDDFYVRIRNNTASDTPGPTDLSSIEHTDFSPNGEWKLITFSSPVVLTKGTRYWIVANNSAADLTSGTNGYAWYYDYSDPYSGEGIRAASGPLGTAWSATWYPQDLNFILRIEANVTLTGTSSGDEFGCSVSGGSDIGGDSVPDIIVGAPYNDGKSADGGAVYIFNGSSSLPSTLLASNADYINYSYSAGAHFGFSVSKAGDVNGDGFNDVIAASPAYSTNSGKAEILSCRKPPEITAYDLTDSVGVSRLNAQIDVNGEYHFLVNITHPNGWDKVDFVKIHAWYDFGSEANSYNGTLGGNTNMFLEYENTTGTAQFTLKWPTGGEVTLGTCTETYINGTSRTLNFSFTPMYQFRHAPGDTSWDSGPGFNDLNSWNFEINVTDSGGWYDSADDEFGVYRYTYVYAVTNPDGTGFPGDTVPMSSSTLYYRTNDAFRLNVSISDLTSGLGTITADNVGVNWTGHIPDSFVSFVGAGAANAIWIYGSDAPNYESAPANGTEQSISVYWQVYIPAGTLGGATYTAPVTYWISQG